MLQTVMQQNLLFYGIGILSFFGVVSQIWLWGIYSRMTKDMENERAAKGKADPSDPAEVWPPEENGRRKCQHPGFY